jgi:hypothetical protein
MTASYDSVKALLSKGISRPTLYQVIMDDPDRRVNDQLEFLCSETRVPEVTANTIAVRGHEHMGVVREQATNIQFASPFSIKVISDRDYIVYKAMRRWFDSLAQNANPALFGGTGGISQRINYYDSVTRTIELVKLEQQGGRGIREPGKYIEPFRVRFNNAFPVRIGSIELGSDLTDTATEFTIDFAYENYTFVETGGIGGGIVGAIASTLGTLLG